jgi:hypothetical protein
MNTQSEEGGGYGSIYPKRTRDAILVADCRALEESSCPSPSGDDTAGNEPCLHISTGSVELFTGAGRVCCVSILSRVSFFSIRAGKFDRKTPSRPLQRARSLTNLPVHMTQRT